jgi:hypothetical protein
MTREQQSNFDRLTFNKNHYAVTVYYKTPSGRDSSYYWTGLAYGFNDAVSWAKSRLFTDSKRKCQSVVHTTIEAMLDYV